MSPFTDASVSEMRSSSSSTVLGSGGSGLRFGDLGDQGTGPTCPTQRPGSWLSKKLSHFPVIVRSCYRELYIGQVFMTHPVFTFFTNKI
jgi:hypothetical protein